MESNQCLPLADAFGDSYTINKARDWMNGDLSFALDAASLSAQIGVAWAVSLQEGIGRGTAPTRQARLGCA